LAAQAPPTGAPQPPFSAAASEDFTLAGTPLSKPVPAQIQYRASWLGGLSPNRLSVWQLVGGKWTFVPTAINASQGTVSAYESGPATLVILCNSTRLADMTSTFWANPAVDTLLGADAVNGYPGGSYRPESPVTRAEFIKMLVLSLGLSPSVTPPNFADVSASDWEARYSAAAVQAGLVQGVGPDTFDPSGALTRDQMAVLLARALKLQGSATDAFTDASQVESWAQASLAADLLSGYPDGTFHPLDSSTRAEAAQVLAALIHTWRRRADPPLRSEGPAAGGPLAV
jgi:hypothetical protein